MTNETETRNWNWQFEIGEAINLHDLSQEALQNTAHFSVSLEHPVIRVLDDVSLQDFSKFISGEVSGVFNVGNCVGRVEGLLQFMKSLIVVATAQGEKAKDVCVFDVLRALGTIVPLELAKLRLAAGDTPDEIKEVLQQLATDKSSNVDKSKLN